MNKFKYVLAFAFGFSSGYFICKRFIKKKYEILAEEEIECMREWFSKKLCEKVEDNCNTVNHSTHIVSNSDKTTEKEEEYVTIIRDSGYSDDDYENGPMIISPNEFGEDDEYDTISLSYFDDGVLADDMLCIIDNIADVVGEDFASHFGEYEYDSVFVKNDRLKSYYEILLEHRTYSDAVNHE